MGVIVTEKGYMASLLLCLCAMSLRFLYDYWTTHTHKIGGVSGQKQCSAKRVLGIPHQRVFISTNTYTRGLLCHFIDCPMPTLFGYAGHEQVSFCTFPRRQVCAAPNAVAGTSCYNIGKFCNPRVGHECGISKQ